MPVASLEEAAAVASLKVQGQFEVPTLLRTPLTAWLAGIVTAMDTPVGKGNVQSIPQRTVYNQVPIGREILEGLPTLLANQNQQDSNIVGVYVYRSCKAARYALIGGRISAAQGAAILAQFNSVFP